MHLDWFKGFLIPLINFIIFAALFIKFGKKPIRDFFYERSQRFSKDAEKSQKEFELVKKEFSEASKKFESLSQELSLYKEQTRQLVEEKVLGIQKQAESLSVQMKEEAKKSFENELRSQIEVIRQDMVTSVYKQIEDELSRKKEYASSMDGYLKKKVSQIHA